MKVSMEDLNFSDLKIQHFTGRPFSFLTRGKAKDISTETVA